MFLLNITTFSKMTFYSIFPLFLKKIIIKNQQYIFVLVTPRKFGKFPFFCFCLSVLVFVALLYEFYIIYTKPVYVIRKVEVVWGVLKGTFYLTYFFFLFLFSIFYILNTVQPRWPRLKGASVTGWTGSRCCKFALAQESKRTI